MIDFFRRIFDTDGFPPRWNCGHGWTAELGWTHIISDIAIFASYMAIPIVLATFIIRRKDAPFPRIFWLFVAFIFLCGCVHLIEAIIFWQPVYRFSGMVKAATAVVSIATVCSLIPVMPRALSLRSPEQLEQEVQHRTRKLQQSEAHQRVLMSELDHRVKNNITAIMSLADQTMASTGEFAAFRESFMGRLLALTRTHEALAKSKWAGAELTRIIQLTLDPYQYNREHPLDVDGPDVRLDAKGASSLCMALHELATNSVKYGALSARGGSISLRWYVDDTGLHIHWTERGGPPIQPPSTTGFGTQLVHGMIEFELEGKVTIEFPKRGLECVMMIPRQHLTDESHDA
jgi:two-component sensor histidine kinase